MNGTYIQGVNGVGRDAHEPAKAVEVDMVCPEVIWAQESAREKRQDQNSIEPIEMENTLRTRDVYI